MKRVLLGMLTPSSNTALEPLCAAMLRELPEVSAHFGRFRVTQIALSPQALGQFQLEPILQAARLLADAKVDVITWNGTAAGWLGFDADVRLCEAITRETGIPATTSILALNELMALAGCQRFAMLSPYTADVQQRIVDNYARHGITCVAERHLGISDNFAFSEVEPEQLARMAHDVAGAAPDCITTYCTNLRAAHLAARLEDELGLPFFDTVSTAMWGALRAAGVDTRRVRGWGRLFEVEARRG